MISALPPPPAHWKRVSGPTFFKAWDHAIVPLRVLLSRSTTRDGRIWWHLSVSHERRVPSWAELSKCKEEFLGDLEAYQVLPKRRDYVNVMPHCLHLWAPVDGQRCVANLHDLVLEEAP
jgi:hypothetical protein